MRWLTFSINNKQYLSLMDAQKNFWQIETHSDQKLTRELKQFSLIFKWCCLIFVFLGGFGCFSFAVGPFLNNNDNQLPLICWIPNDNATPYYQIIYILQFYVLFMATTIVGGFDTYYVSITLRYIIQFKLLRYEMEKLGERDDKETEMQIKNCVNYHNFLLR